MKKKLLIGLGGIYICILACCAAGIVYFWSYISAINWNLVNVSNMKALYVGLTEDPEVTKEKQKELDSERSRQIRDYIQMDIRDLTEEEKREISEGKRTETEILAQIIAEAVEGTTEPLGTENGSDGNTGDNNTSVNKPQNNSPAGDKGNTGNTQGNAETADQIVARHIAVMYSIQNEFEGRVAALASSAHNWAAAYRSAHGCTWKEAKVAGVQHFSNTASDIEIDCYNKVDAQIALLKSDLKAIGADISISDTIKSTVYAEMDARKAQIVQMGRSKLSKEG